MQFNIIIPTHGRTNLLIRTLESLSDTKKPKCNINVTVIENGTNDGAKNICKKFEQKLPIYYKHQKKAGKGRALQCVINNIQYGFVLFLDDDIRVCNDLLINYAEFIYKFGKGYIYGGPLLIDYETEPDDWLKKYLPNSVTGWSIKHYSTPFIDEGYFLGANFGAFVEDIHSVGGFSEDVGPGAYVPGTENNPTGVERELQDRLLNAGMKRLYVHNAKVWHYVPRNNCTPSWALHRAYRNEILSGFLFEKNNPTKSIYWIGFPVNLLMIYLLNAFFVLVAFFIPFRKIRFRLKRGFYKVRGKIKGHQLARK